VKPESSKDCISDDEMDLNVNSSYCEVKSESSPKSNCFYSHKASPQWYEPAPELPIESTRPETSLQIHKPPMLLRPEAMQEMVAHLGNTIEQRQSFGQNYVASGQTCKP
jgi:hypothetical protein